MSATAIGDHDARVDARPRRRRLPASLLRLASDEHLVELLRGNSEAAFETLYTRHHRGVLSFCRHMLGSAEEAEDALQHTFLAAYRDLVGSSKEIQLRPWLYAIARNRCLSVLRARREQATDEPADPSTEHLSIEVERRQELRALLGDLAALPDDQRAALVLAELGDMSHDEIGHALGCQKDKVKALVFQARTSLIASRDAREASCEQIREQLANLRGGALRRNLLRRHLRDCAGCREFRDRVQDQRRELALILPVAPSLGLKAAVLGAGGAVATSSVVAKTAIVLAVAGTGAAAVETVSERPAERPGPPPAVAAAVRPPVAASVVTTVPAADVARIGGRGDGGAERVAGDDQDRALGTERGRRLARGHDRPPGADEGPGKAKHVRGPKAMKAPNAFKVRPVKAKAVKVTPPGLVNAAKGPRASAPAKARTPVRAPKPAQASTPPRAQAPAKAPNAEKAPKQEPAPKAERVPKAEQSAE